MRENIGESEMNISKEFAIACIENGYDHVKDNWDMWLCDGDRKLCHVGMDFSFKLQRDNQGISLTGELSGLYDSYGKVNRFILEQRYRPKWKMEGNVRHHGGDMNMTYTTAIKNGIAIVNVFNLTWPLDTFKMKEPVKTTSWKGIFRQIWEKL